MAFQLLVLDGSKCGLSVILAVIKACGQTDSGVPLGLQVQAARSLAMRSSGLATNRSAAPAFTTRSEVPR